MIITAMVLSLAFQEADPPAAPVSDDLARQASSLRHVETDDRSNIDAQVMQEQAREERDADEDRQTQSSDNDADEPRQRRRQEGPSLRPVRRPNPGG